MRLLPTVHVVGCGVLASLAAAQLSDESLLHPVPVGGADDGGDSAPEPEPAPPPQHCKFYQDCWKLTIPGARHEFRAAHPRGRSTTSTPTVSLSVLP